MAAFDSLGKLLVMAGTFILLLGLLLIFWNKIPFLGNLPGDIFIQKGNFRFFFPVVTCLVISALLTFLINVLPRLLGK
ncbi:MAG: DUF2905 domain-containing protein [Dehalococcoidia bacterium]